jgi:hypothetical protein
MHGPRRRRSATAIAATFGPLTKHQLVEKPLQQFS